MIESGSLSQIVRKPFPGGDNGDSTLTARAAPSAATASTSETTYWMPPLPVSAGNGLPKLRNVTVVAPCRNEYFFVPKRGSSTGGSSSRPTKPSIERPAAREIGDREPDLDRRELLGRRARHDHELDRLAVRILHERSTPLRAALGRELRRRITVLREPLRKRRLVGEEERDQPKSRRIGHAARLVRAVLRAPRELELLRAGLKPRDSARIAARSR